MLFSSEATNQFPKESSSARHFLWPTWAGKNSQLVGELHDDAIQPLGGSVSISTLT